MDSLDKKDDMVPRRRFLAVMTKFWALATVVPIVDVVVKFIIPVKSTEALRETIRAGSVSDIALNSAKIVRFNKDPVIVVRTLSGQFKAFSARCTHLGCVVQFKPDDGAPHFVCNCHGSQFDINGKNIAGPAPRPLTPFKVSIDETSILVTKV